MTSLCQISRPTHSRVMMPWMGCLLAAELLIHIKTRFKKTVIKPFKKTTLKKTDIKKGAYGPFQIGFLR